MPYRTAYDITTKYLDQFSKIAIFGVVLRGQSQVTISGFLQKNVGQNS